MANSNASETQAQETPAGADEPVLNSDGNRMKIWKQFCVGINPTVLGLNDYLYVFVK